MIYDAFISYRHAPLDMEIAKKVHSGLESYRIPGATAKKYGKKKIQRVFRDQEELPIGSDLDDNITKALRESEFLIVICSPRTPGSEWVCKEIETFIELHDRQHVLAVLVEGEPDESFPALLLTDAEGNPVEPLAADVRGETAKERNEKLKTELLRLAAPLIGCSFDDLKQRHRERKIKQMAIAACSVFSVAAILGIGFAIYNAHMAAQIEKNYQLAIENQYKYMADKSLDLSEEGYRKDAAIMAAYALADEGDTKKPYVPQAELALSGALNTYAIGESVKKDGMLEHEVPVTAMEYDTDGCHLITTDRNNKVYVWEVKEENRLITTLAPHINEEGRSADVIAFDHVGEEYVVVSEIGVFGYDEQGQEIWSVPVDSCVGGLVNAEKRIAVMTYRQTCDIVNLNTHAIEKTFTLEDDSLFLLTEVKYDAASNIVYASCGGETPKAKVMVADLSKDTFLLADAKENCISKITFSDEGYLYVVSYDMDSLMKHIASSFTAYLQKIETSTGKELWCYSNEFMDSSLSTNAQIVLKYRNYSDEQGQAHKELIFTGNEDIICIDAESGKELSKLSMGSGVRNALVSGVNRFGYAALSNGDIEIIDYPAGSRRNGFLVSTGRNLTDMRVREAVFAIRAYASPDVLIMKYVVGNDVEQIFTATDNVDKVYESNNKKITALFSNALGEGTIHFLLWKNEKQAELENTVTVPFSGSVTNSFFTAKDQFFIYDMDGNACLIDPKSGEMTKLQVETFAADGGGIMAADPTKTYAVCFAGSDVSAFDVTSGKQIGQWVVPESRISEAVISADGKNIYFMDDAGVLKMIDTRSADSAVPFARETVSDGLSNYVKQTMTLSEGGDFLAVTCKDGILRVLKTRDGSECTAVNFSGFGNSFMAFDRAQEHLIVQGDDYYIHVYDILTGENLYTSDGQYETIQSASEIMDGKRLVLTMVDQILVLETDSFMPVAHIPEGKMIGGSGQTVLAHYENVYKCPYQSAAGLKKNLERQFEDRTFSEHKKLKYHMNFED